MTVTIVPAQPTPEDVVAFAELANMASHDLLAHWLGKGYARVLAKLYLRADNLFSHQYSHFALVGGQIAGLLHGYTHAQLVEHNRRTTFLLLRSLGLGLPRSLILLFQLQPLFSFMESLQPGSYYVEELAVYPQARGSGLGKRLLQHADTVARAGGCRTLELDVETTNEVALRAYGSHGMREGAVSPAVFFRQQNREITYRRMIKQLAPTEDSRVPTRTPP